MIIKIWTEKDIEDLEYKLRNISFDIIDVFEEFLENHGITITNDEKEGEETEAIIYGTDYGYLEDGIVSVLKYDILNNKNGVM